MICSSLFFADNGGVRQKLLRAHPKPLPAPVEPKKSTKSFGNASEASDINRQLKGMYKHLRLSARELGALCTGVNAKCGNTDHELNELGQAARMTGGNAHRKVTGTLCKKSTAPPVYKTRIPFWNRTKNCMVSAAVDILLIYEILDWKNRKLFDQ